MRWRDWQGDTWESAHALQAARGSQLECDMATARARKYVPHSLRARFERLAQSTRAAERARGERLLEACEAGVADDMAIEEMFDAYVLHAGRGCMVARAQQNGPT